MTDAPIALEVTPSESPEAEDWDTPLRRPPESTSPVLSVDGFDGPLDWLLELARARKLDLRRLSILALIDAFAEAMQVALLPGTPALELARWASWTVMATQLTELRSRLLLPSDTTDAKGAQAEAEALRRHWLGRSEMLAAADWLDARPQLGREVLGRGRLEMAGQGSDAKTAICSDATETGEDAEVYDPLTELFRACLVALRLPTHADGYQPRQLPFWSVGDAAARISRMLETLSGGAQLEAFLPEILGDGPKAALRRRAAHAATLIAGLELARGGGVTLEQPEDWQPIHLQ